VFLFGFGFHTEADAGENVRDMLARRDMLRESEHWREVMILSLWQVVEIGLTHHW
jgi:hypothetical protein